MALQLQNWNENRIKENEFKNVLEQIYNSIDRDIDWYNWTIHFAGKQNNLILSFLNHPDSIPSDKVINMLVYLDAFPVSINSESPYFLSKFAPDHNNSEHNQLAQAIYKYTSFTNLKLEYQLVPSIQTYLFSKGYAIEQPRFGGQSFNNFKNVSDNTFYSEIERQNILPILNSEEFKSKLRTLHSLKKRQINFYSGKKLTGINLKKQIEEYFPDVRLLYTNIDVVISDISEEWNDSIPMYLTDKKLNIWEADLNLNNQYVKFRSNNNWLENWGGESFPSGKSIFYGDNIFVKPGFYKVLFNLNDKTYRFVEIDEPKE